MQKNIKLRIVFGLSIGILLWMSTGFFKSDPTNKSAKILEQSKVKTITSVAETKTKYLSLSAIAYANDKIKLVSQVSGTIISKFVSDGTKMKQGDKIVQVENRALLSSVKHSKNAVKEAKLKYEAATRLLKENLGSVLDLENAQTALKASQAQLSALETELANSTIIAPFDGMIDSISVDKGDIVSTLGSGKDVIGTFINLSNIEAKAYISQNEREELINGQDGYIEAHNMKTPVKITFISSSADENTGTFLVKAVGANQANIGDGEAIKLKVKIGDCKSHKIPVSALLIDKDGDLSLRIIDDTEIKKEIKVSIFDEDDQSVWVLGLPDKANIMLTG